MTALFLNSIYFYVVGTIWELASNDIFENVFCFPVAKQFFSSSLGTVCCNRSCNKTACRVGFAQ